MADRKTTNVDARIGARVRVRRLELGMSQMALAERLDMTFQQIQKYEKGVNRIACSTLVELSLVLEASTSWFLGEREGVEDTMLGVFDSDSLKLLSLFRKVDSPSVRSRILALVGSLVDAAEPAAALQNQNIAPQASAQTGKLSEPATVRVADDRPAQALTTARAKTAGRNAPTAGTPRRPKARKKPA